MLAKNVSANSAKTPSSTRPASFRGPSNHRKFKWSLHPQSGASRLNKVCKTSSAFLRSHSIRPRLCAGITTLKRGTPDLHNKWPKMSKTSIHIYTYASSIEPFNLTCRIACSIVYILVCFGARLAQNVRRQNRLGLAHRGKSPKFRVNEPKFRGQPFVHLVSFCWAVSFITSIRNVHDHQNDQQMSADYNI